MKDRPIQTMTVGVGVLNLGLILPTIQDAAQRDASVGRVVLLQTSTRPEGPRIVDALNAHGGVYSVRVEGVRDGKTVQRTETIEIAAGAFSAERDWNAAADAFLKVDAVTSNTAERGFDLVEGDASLGGVPRSFPAKLVRLLLARFEAGRGGVTFYPCELVSGNGALLREAVLSQAERMKGLLPAGFSEWVVSECRFVGTLVDRIVSKKTDPASPIPLPVCEPFAMWAVERAPGAAVPWKAASAVREVDDLATIERLKLGVLNCAHTFWTDRWLREGRPESVATVFAAAKTAAYRAAWGTLFENEILPVLNALAPREDVRGYAAEVFERFENPFLNHRLESIAMNHRQKVQVRLGTVRAWAREVLPGLPTPGLDALVNR